jgi:predicted ATPase
MGGVDTTRLAVAAADELAAYDCFPDGCGSDLSGIVDSERVPRAIAEALGLRDLPR